MLALVFAPARHAKAELLHGLALLAAQFGDRLGLLALHRFVALRVGTQFVTGAFCEGRSSRGIGRFLALGNKMFNRSMTVGEVGWERGRLRPASAP